MPKSYYQKREDDLRALINEVKIRHKLTTAQLAKKIGMPYGTLNNKIPHPGSLKADQVWMIEQMAEKGREMR